MGQAQELMRRITDAVMAGDAETLATCYAAARSQRPRIGER